MLAPQTVTERDLLLGEHAEKDLLRLVVAGSVDDGKSTLIGRLLYECDGLFEDQIAAVRRAAAKRAGGAEVAELDFALFTDGLEAEREQGITIDVAYRYLTTGRRKLIIADTPGHLQYTRNMATGASTADAVIILIDATLGVLQQTRRHAYIASLLGIPRVAVAVNKLDLLGYDRAVFDRIAAEFSAFSAGLGFTEVRIFPVSGKGGDNIATQSLLTPWFEGGTLLAWIEALPNERARAAAPFRMAVQTVLRPNASYRGFAGQIASGTVRPGDELVILPSGQRTRVAAVDTFDGPQREARAPASIAVRLADEIDVARGDLLADPASPPRLLRHLDATLVWFSERALEPGRRYSLKQLTRTVPASIDHVLWRKDLETLAEVPADTLAQNDIGRVRITTQRPLVGDPYLSNRRTGAFIVIDEASNDTVAAGMIIEALEPAAATAPHAQLTVVPGGGEPARAPAAPPSLALLPRVAGEGPARVGLGDEKSALLGRLAEGLDRDALQWMSGYFAGLAAGQPALQLVGAQPAQAPVAAPPQAAPKRATVIYGSQTGNSRHLATGLHARLEQAGFSARLLRTTDYPVRELADEALLYLVVSTQGDGDPPDDSLAFVEHLLGRRAPKLPKLNYGVLALGDSSYPQFCGVGRRLDARLAELGARRVLDRGDLDLDFEEAGAAWIASALDKAPEALGAGVGAAEPGGRAAPGNVAWSRDNPFVAEVLEVQRITGRGANKDVRHVELSLEGSGLSYEPGDSLGVWATNPPGLVAELLEAAGLDGAAQATRSGRSAPLATWLSEELEITTASRPFLEALRDRSGREELAAALATPEALRALLDTHQVIDLVRAYPAAWSAEAFVASLRKLTPRLYSIASSQQRVGEEVHLTVAVVDYEAFGTRHVGAASWHLAHARPGETVRVFVESNDRFRLPADPDRDVLLIGPGTGVAPYRAFVQERAERAVKGRSWLFFGEQHFHSQFLYQVEWQEALRRGQLSRLSLAFSRDQEERIYVQQRLREAGAEVFAWLEGGAHVYVCGDSKRMAPDVHEALVEIVATHGGYAREDAERYLETLRNQARYQRDVY